MIISKLKLVNFKRFPELEIPFDEHLNILVGDNESGKSSILQAIDIVIRGSRYMVEEIGLERLFNDSAVNRFMQLNPRSIEHLPKLIIELFLNDSGNPVLNGENNSEQVNHDGIRCICQPNEEYSETIASILASADPAFPFEYYDITFSTFRGDQYNGHNRPMRDVFIDNSMIGSDFAMFQYVQDIYKAKLSDEERTLAKHKYHAAKCQFRNDVLAQYDPKLAGYSFAVKDSSKDNLDTDLTIMEDGIDISNKGTGKQCYIKTELALKQANDHLDVVLIEEPENHLSHANMRKMIQAISESRNKQLFIATHSNLISTRLDLRKCSIFNKRSTSFVQLKDISEETAAFFMKAPDNNLLQFILSSRSILVEGDAEFMMMDFFSRRVLTHPLDHACIDVISVDGKCFKRYLEIARRIGTKTAVITDNDGDFQKNIQEAYSGYMNNEVPDIRVFSDTDDARYTFEKCIYLDNTEICQAAFGAHRRTLTVEQFMLSDKAECAYRLANSEPENFIVPGYIQEALRWISE